MGKFIRAIASGKRLAKDRKGLVALEYGLMAGVAAVVIIVGFNILGSDLSAKFSAVGTLAKTATAATTATAAP